MCKRTNATIEAIKKSDLSDVMKLHFITQLEKTSELGKSNDKLLVAVRKLLQENREQNKNMEFFRNNCNVSFAKHEKNREDIVALSTNQIQLMELIPIIRKQQESLSFFRGAVWVFGAGFIMLAGLVFAVARDVYASNFGS